jgi:hypothetical protein
VVCAEALGYLQSQEAPAHSSVITSLPDVSEVPSLDMAGWQAWFVGTIEAILRWLPPDGVAIFFQSDIRHQGAWVDKGYLVQSGIARAGARTVFHKIVCRKPAGTISMGRPSYSHMIAAHLGPARGFPKPGPDVLASAGHMVWSRAMGEEACRVACRFLVENTSTQWVVDPFCGKGSVLAMANAFGLDALGVDLSDKRCRAARRAVVVGSGA